MIFQVVLLTWMMAHGGASIQVDPVPYGVVALRGGEVRVEKGTYEVVVVKHHPRHIRTTLFGELQTEARALLDEVRHVKPSQAKVYQIRLDALDWSRRRRRGWIDGVGELFKTMFGTATTKDVNEVREKVNELISQHNEAETIIQDLIICVNDTRTEQEHVVTKVNELVAKVNSIQTNMSYLTSSMRLQAREILYMQSCALLENILSLMELYKAEEESYDQMFRYKRDLAIVGHLTESLVPKELLSKVRKEVSIELSDEYLYKNLEVRIMQLSGDKLGYWFSIPIFNDEIYTEWELLTVPYYGERAPRQVKPEANYVGVGFRSGKLIELRHCKYEEPRVCPAPIEYSSLLCVEGIIAKDDDKLKQCTVDPASQHLVKRLSLDTLLLSTRGEKLEERCRAQETNVRKLLPGTYIIRMLPGCKVQSSLGWSFEVMEVHRREITLNDILVLEDRNITFSKPTQTPVMNMVNHNISRIVAARHARLPSVTKLHYVHYLYASGSVAGYVALIIALIICVIAIIVYVKRRKTRRLKPQPKDNGAGEVELELQTRKPAPLYPVIQQFSSDNV